MFHTKIRHPFLWIAIILLLLGGAGIAAALLGQPAVQAQESPPAGAPASPTQIPFSHQVHVEEVGVQCLFCHSDAIRAPQASLPSLDTCMTCHAYVTVDEDAQSQVDQVIQAYESQARVQWPDVYKQPDFVYFSHRPHVANGVACQTCHGPVETMTLVEQRVDMNMGFCLNCHQERIKQNPEMPAVEKERLIDCATCHK